MKTIGIIGGMSWESTCLYYQHINRLTREHFGEGLRSAHVLIDSLNMAEIAEKQRNGDWIELAGILSQSAETLERAGADCILIATNTMHKVAADVQAHLHVPLLHIADAVAHNINQHGGQRIALLGTKFTMEQAFYRDILNQHGIDVVIPNTEQRHQIHEIIFKELCCGIIKPNSCDVLRQIISTLATEGADGVILGCTELVLAVEPNSTPIRCYDSTFLHAKAAVDFALDDTKHAIIANHQVINQRATISAAQQ